MIDKNILYAIISDAEARYLQSSLRGKDRISGYEKIDKSFQEEIHDEICINEIEFNERSKWVEKDDNDGTK